MYFELGWLILGYVVCVIVLFIVAGVLFEKASSLIASSHKYAIQSAIQQLGNSLLRGETWLSNESDRILLRALGKYLLDSGSAFVDMRDLRQAINNERSLPTGSPPKLP